MLIIILDDCNLSNSTEPVANRSSAWSSDLSSSCSCLEAASLAALEMHKHRCSAEPARIC